MIYVESFRHLVQEWIEIQHPRDVAEWPWDPDSRLFMINLYPVSSGETLMKRPTPFISILINQLEKVQPWLIHEGQYLYRSYFERPSFKLPRKYVYDPLVNGDKSLKTSRYTFESDSYGNLASDWSGEDLRLARILAHRPHVRYSVYDSHEYHSIRARLDALEAKADHGVTVPMAENLFDLTEYAENQPAHDMALMLIQAPVVGIVKPMRKSKEYKIINGALIMVDDVQLSINEEPCHEAYQKERIPFEQLVGAEGHKAMGVENSARAIVYVAAEVPCGIFTFQEVTPSDTVETGMKDTYVRVINHQFIIAPEASNKKGRKIEVRLHHTITEGLMPKVKECNAFFARRNEKLFYRSDMPNGFIKQQGGNAVSMSMPME